MTDHEFVDGGFFAASVVYGHDKDRTHAELERCGRAAFNALMREAIEDPAPVDSLLLQRIHRAWFGEAFPGTAGTWRREIVISRRPKVSEPHAIPNDVAAAFVGFDDDWCRAGGDFNVRRAATKGEIRQLVRLANGITVRLHHIHPFLDGNTRTCLTLRAYLLARAGLPAVTGRHAEARAREAWNAAAPFDHDALDHVLLDQLSDALLQG